MATSKLLKPTNVTISIPEFTDQPDQRVNSNCIDKEADAINSLNDQIVTEYTDTASFATGITGTKRITKKNGVVTLNLSNIQGLTAHGSQILTLSTGFRPSSQITVPAFIKDTGAWASADTYVGVLNIETTGVIEYNGKTSNINGKVLYAGCSYTV